MLKKRFLFIPFLILMNTPEVFSGIDHYTPSQKAEFNNCVNRDATLKLHVGNNVSDFRTDSKQIQKKKEHHTESGETYVGRGDSKVKRGDYILTSLGNGLKTSDKAGKIWIDYKFTGLSLTELAKYREYEKLYLDALKKPELEDKKSTLEKDKSSVRTTMDVLKVVKKVDKKAKKKYKKKKKQLADIKAQIASIEAEIANLIDSDDAKKQMDDYYNSNIDNVFESKICERWNGVGIDPMRL